MKLFKQLFCSHYYQLIGSYDVFKDVMVYTNTYQYSYDLLMCSKCGKEKHKRYNNPSHFKMK